MLWVFLVTVIMLFAGFSSALIVARADAIAKDQWIPINIPSTFTISTIIIILSSVSMQWAYFNAKQNEIYRLRWALWITALLGIVFVYSQWMGYESLVHDKIHPIGTVQTKGGIVPYISSSFFYLISGVHALHVVGGIIFVLATLRAAYNLKIHSRKMLQINLCTTYWHFIGALWVYLFILLKFID